MPYFLKCLYGFFLTKITFSTSYKLTLTNTTLCPNRLWWAQTSSVPACAGVGMSRWRGVIPGAGTRGGADGYGAAAANARGPVCPGQGVPERGADRGQAARVGAGWCISADTPQTSYPPFRRYKVFVLNITSTFQPFALVITL